MKGFVMKKGCCSMRKLALKVLKFFQKYLCRDDLKCRGVDLIPAWFTSRMIDDVWGFGLLLENGNILGIECIEKIYQAVDGSLWMDVRLLSSTSNIAYERLGDKLVIAPMPDRCNASVNISKIVAAFEIFTS
jgi:hypothetical protein